jgi:uncharacterized UPF0160 family protein
VKAVTHKGRFHGDEVFALAVLKLVYPKLEVIRTRDEKEFKDADFLIDIGKKFDNEKFFDHHQKDFRERRKNGLPYASAGLIWKKFFGKLTNEKVYSYLDEKIFQFIDVDDNGLKVFESEVCKVYTIGSVINGVYDSENSDGSFFVVLDFVVELLRNEIKHSEKLFEAEAVIREKLDSSNEEYLILGNYVPWRRWLAGNERIKFVIYKGLDSDGWCSVGNYVGLEGYERVAYFPEEWAGLSGEEFEKVSGVDGAVFCHKNRFICVAKTEGEVLELTKLALGRL